MLNGNEPSVLDRANLDSTKVDSSNLTIPFYKEAFKEILLTLKV